MASAEKVLEILKTRLKSSANRDNSLVDYTEAEKEVIREYSYELLTAIERYENGSEDIIENKTNSRYMIGTCDHCLEDNRYLEVGYDNFDVPVVDICAYGCDDKRSIPVQ